MVENSMALGGWTLVEIYIRVCVCVFIFFNS